MQGNQPYSGGGYSGYPTPPDYGGGQSAGYSAYSTPSQGVPDHNSGGYSAPPPAYAPSSYGTVDPSGQGGYAYQGAPQHSYYGSEGAPAPSAEAYGSYGAPQSGAYQTMGDVTYSTPSYPETFSSSAPYPVTVREETSYGGSVIYNQEVGGSSHAPGSGPGATAYAASGLDSSYGGQVMRYDAGGDEPYGARGTENTSSQLIDIVDPRKSVGGGYGRATPADVVEGPNGVQRFRVRLMPEEGSAGSSQQVLCQVGLDGVKLIEPSSQRMLRIYPLETITRWAVREPSVFTFWAKNSADIEQRAVRLSSNSATTNSILDALTAACVQLCEMIGKDGPSGGHNPAASSANAVAAATAVANAEASKPASFMSSILQRKAAEPEVREHWVPDEATRNCTACGVTFTTFNRRHHCRNCGDVFCDNCTKGRIALTAEEGAQPVRVCDRCLAEVTQRLQNAAPVTAKPAAAPRSHEDLAKKLQEEMERNKQRANPPAPVSSGGGTQVVTCSTCGSVNLSNGSETRCNACGASTSRPAPPKPASSGRSSYTLDGPPHLWGSQGSDARRPRMKEVACPTCTVHLTVKVPSSGTETVECEVCQHPFLVAA